VVLTGANGLVGGYITEALLEKGYTVHGTVRPSTLKKTAAVQHLKDMEERLPGTLKLFPVEISGEPGIYDEATTGCAVFMQTAFYIPTFEEVQSMPAGIAKDFYSYQVASGVNGTLAATEVAKKFRLKKIIQTSSVAAEFPTKAKHGKTLYDSPHTEEDWNDVSSLGYGNYNYGKTKAEKALYEWKEANPSGPQVASMLFAFASGPPQQKRIGSSTAAVHMALQSTMNFMYMPLNLWWVDIRDVARAHVYVMEHAEGEGRFNIASSHDPAIAHRSIGQIAALFQKHFPEYPVPSVAMPLWLLSLLPKLGVPGLDPGLMEFASEYPGFDGSKLKNLGFEFQHKDIDKSLIETAQGIIAVGGAMPGKNMDPTLSFGGAFICVLTMIRLLKLCCCSNSRSREKGSKQQ
jgi:nucleoside-diphosphate-sugar epimerase